MNWFETEKAAEGIFRIREPGVDPAAAGNIWFIHGEKEDLFFDAGMGLMSLRACLPDFFKREPKLIFSHSHYDHIGGGWEFPVRLMHRSEASILREPNRRNTCIEGFLKDEHFYKPPFEGFRSELFEISPAPPTAFLDEGDVIDLGKRELEVLHLPGHSPGLIGLFEKSTGFLFSSDALYDGRLYDDVYHSDKTAFAASLRRILRLPFSRVFGGHFAPFSAERAKKLISINL